MLAEVLIFVPSIARFRETYLNARLERAQIASLALLAEDMLDPDLERELLENAEVFNVVLRRDELRQLVLSSPIPSPIWQTYDMRDPSVFALIGDAIVTLLEGKDRVIRVVGQPVRMGGEQIEITIAAGPLRAAMIDYGVRILILSAVISVLTALLLFLAVRRLMVRPIRRVVSAMQSYAEAPEDARNIIDPSSQIRELRDAENALRDLETQLSQALRQKQRLALLGGAVAKINHDLRNVLTTAQLFGDRMEESRDPQVARLAPKLLNSLRRAESICEATLAFGKADEPPPQLRRFPLAALVEDVLEAETLAAEGSGVTLVSQVRPDIEIRADREQLHRALDNLVRNARQAMTARRVEGTITVSASESDAGWSIRVADTGPGIPARMQETLFQPFQSASKKGTGLGLTIAQELVRGHGGTLKLVESGPAGTSFEIVFPRSVQPLN
ncbi:sensor histidine kinase [Palleronia caenipelagi]|uniref:histidine kinase n=1 Tax=Palleronia caenipelagi TaxID=2489174 RepID=A0A547Q7G7_9RHOB|nr:HAMP domain-containing sensor histidine kinase [Palleronia caenipelagi]TRD22311.1 HAMP domain-containing histidine kinase [Palleronia caenipelagi]